MKVNNLLKKVGSVITTAALLATLGTTAFADGENVSTKPGKGISITSVTTTKVDDNGLYNVKVEYATTVDNVTGMTMLAYRAKDSSGNPSDTALGTAYSNDMQIVGIDQKEPVKNNSGSFEFKVTTNTDANGFYIQKGKKALIAVSGDQCEPAYATLLLNATAQSASDVKLNNVEVPANADVKTKLIEEAKGKTVDLYEGTTMLNSVSLQNLQNTDFSGFSNTGNEYTFKAKLTKSNITVPEGVDFPDDGIEVKFTATITKTAVSGTVTKLAGQTVTTSGSELSAELTVSKKDLGENPDISALTSLLNTNFKTATISDGGNPALEDTINATFALENPDTTYGGNEYRYIATVGGDDEASLKGEKGEVKLNAKATIKVKVTLSEDSITVNGIVDKENNSITAIDSVTIPSGTTEETAIIDAVKAELAKKEYKLAYKKNNSEDLSYASIPVDNTVNVVYSSTSVVPDTSDTTKGTVTFNIASIDGISTTYSFNVPYTTAPAFTYGDVNGDGDIDLSDYNLIKRYSLGKITEFTAADGSIIPNEAADVSGDGDIDLSDYNLIKRYSLGKISSFPAEEGK